MKTLWSVQSESNHSVQTFFRTPTHKCADVDVSGWISSKRLGGVIFSASCGTTHLARRCHRTSQWRCWFQVGFEGFEGFQIAQLHDDVRVTVSGHCLNMFNNLFNTVWMLNVFGEVCFFGACRWFTLFLLFLDVFLYAGPRDMWLEITKWSLEMWRAVKFHQAHRPQRRLFFAKDCQAAQGCFFLEANDFQKSLLRGH